MARRPSRRCRGRPRSRSRRAPRRSRSTWRRRAASSGASSARRAQAHAQLVGEVAASATRHLIQELRDASTAHRASSATSTRSRHDMIAHAEEFRHLERSGRPCPFHAAARRLPRPLPRQRARRPQRGARRAGGRRAEPHARQPGRPDRASRPLRHAVTDFTLIKAGRAPPRERRLPDPRGARRAAQPSSLGGAQEVRSRAAAIRIEEPLEELRLVSTVSLAPEPIPLDVKVVLIGSPLLYYLLYALDEDFASCSRSRSTSTTRCRGPRSSSALRALHRRPLPRGGAAALRRPRASRG